MGVYNPKIKEQLFDSVNSIIDQTFRDWEMIIYDDGSEEQYVDMIKEAAALDERIIYIRNDVNHGLAYALNQCLQEAGGEYIARMDADDISKPERLEKLYNFLCEHSEYEWAGSNSELFDENGVWGTDQMQEIPEEKDFLAYSPYIHPSVIFRKSVLDEMNGYKVSEETKRCEDYELFMRLHKAGYRGYNMQECLLLYREDYNAFQKRKYKYRVQEMKIRYRGFKNLGILRADTVPYVLKPLATGLVPARFLQYIKKNTGKGYYVEQQRESQIGEIQKVSENRSINV